ncbi:hypothetical protein ACIOHS_29145 [Streptomyces sp. NPDC088253]|uniref:hypothetical protein n=1 Tax=Streptomyces sp. NPDC088253 TaxID=3365846 RepID=UPI0037F75E6C
MLGIFGRKKSRKEAVAAQQWESLRTSARQLGPDFHVVQVAEVYQRARNGSKAYVIWAESGARQDTWFEGWAPQPGSHVLLRGSVGYGPHNNTPKVLYVGSGGIHSTASAGARSAWERQQGRQA